MNRSRLASVVLTLALGACAADLSATDGENDVALPDGKADDASYSPCELQAVLDWLNGGASASELRQAGVSSRSRSKLLAHRDGPDRRFGTADDDLFDDLAELDAVPYVGPVTLRQLVAVVADQCVATDPREAALLDPARVTLPYECNGRTLSAAEIIALFDPGHGALRLGYDLGDRAPFGFSTHEQWCNAFSGCGAPRSGGASPLPTHLVALTLDPQRGLEVAVRKETTPVRHQTFTAMPDGDVIYRMADVPFRLRVTKASDGSVCISSAGIDPDARHPTFKVARATVRPPLPAGDPAATAPLTASSLCTGDPLPSRDLYTTWFGGGRLRRDLAGTSEFASRMCHPVTGCSEWRKGIDAHYPLAGVAEPHHLELDPGIGLISLYLTDPVHTYVTTQVQDGLVDTTRDLAPLSLVPCGWDCRLTTYAITGALTSACMAYQVDVQDDQAQDMEPGSSLRFVARYNLRR